MNYSHKREFNWHFIPPYAPNFGGLWESVVRQFKYHFKRIAGNTLLTFEGLTTLACEIESILNSRPLCPMSSDPHDLAVLTPGHLIIGDSLNSIPEIDLTEIPDNRLTLSQHITKCKQHFWKRWNKEYLNELITRRQPKGVVSDAALIQEGSLVLIKEDNLPPLEWARGRVTALHPGQDKFVGVATVKTNNGIFQRAVSKLAPLPVMNDELKTLVNIQSTDKVKCDIEKKNNLNVICEKKTS